MSSDLERRLEALLVEAPEPEAGVGERALERSLAALPEPRRRERRRLRVAVVLVAAALGLLVLAAGSLAAAGALHVSFGHPKRRAASTGRLLTLPPGAAGIAAVVDGRLSVVTRSGFRLQGLPVSAAELSPHALYVAAGIGESLVAMRPDGRRAWSHPAGGRVVTIAWAPDGLRIAYLVRSAGRLVLHVIWGNGTHDAVLARTVRGVRPSWRADSLAFAYVEAGGRALVYDIAHQSRSVVAGSPADVSHVAFAPTGARLSLRAGHEAPGRDGELESLRLGGRVVTFESSGRIFAAVVAGRGTRIVAGTRRRYATVLSLPATAQVESVVVR